MMSSFIEPIRLGLQEAVRRVTVHVTWEESGRGPQSIEVVQYLADPSKLDAALTGGALPGAAGAQPGAQPGANTPSITPSGSKK
jgi:hypothetical protein